MSAYFDQLRATLDGVVASLTAKKIEPRHLSFGGEGVTPARKPTVPTDVLDIFATIASGTGYAIETPAKSQDKATIMLPITRGVQVGTATALPTFAAEHRVTALGRHDAYSTLTVCCPAGRRLRARCGQDAAGATALTRAQAIRGSAPAGNPFPLAAIPHRRQ